jgi:hypothetical protein
VLSECLEQRVLGAAPESASRGAQLSDIGAVLRSHIAHWLALQRRQDGGGGERMRLATRVLGIPLGF